MLSGVVLFAVAFIAIFQETHIEPQNIPAVVNGLTSSLSIVIGFSGAIIGILYREIGEANREAKNSLFAAIVVLIIPVFLLLTTYNFLILGMYSLALKYGFISLILTLYIFVALILYAVRILRIEQMEKTTT